MDGLLDKRRAMAAQRDNVIDERGDLALLAHIRGTPGHEVIIKLGVCRIAMSRARASASRVSRALGRLGLAAQHQRAARHRGTQH